MFHPTTQFTLVHLPHPALHAGRHAERGEGAGGYKVQPLSAFLKQPAPPAAPTLDFPKANAELAKTNFFEYLDFALQFAPAGPEEKEIRAKLARIGIGPGKTFNFKDLSLEHKAAVLLGMKEGEKKVEEKVAAIGKKINGWSVGSAFGDRDFLQWRLAAARRRRQGRHLRQRRRGGHVSHDQDAARRRTARRQQAQLHAHLPRRAASAGERLLVGDDV